MITPKLKENWVHEYQKYVDRVQCILEEALPQGTRIEGFTRQLETATTYSSENHLHIDLSTSITLPTRKPVLSVLPQTNSMSYESVLRSRSSHSLLFTSKAQLHLSPKTPLRRPFRTTSGKTQVEICPRVSKIKTVRIKSASCVLCTTAKAAKETKCRVLSVRTPPQKHLEFFFASTMTP